MIDTGDFQVWTPIESLLLLEMRLYRERDDLAMAQTTGDKVGGPMQPHVEAFKRRLSFNWLNDDRIARCLRDNDLHTPNTWRFSDLSNLFFIRELVDGQRDLDGQRVDITKAEDRIIEYGRTLQQVK